MEPSDEQKKELTRARNTAYRYLSIRARSRSEIEAKLRDKEFSDEVIESVMSGLVRLGYINDERFAEQWASSRMRTRGFGKRRVEQELRLKGVSRDTIHQAVQTVFGEQPEEELARKEAMKKLRTLTRFEPEVQKRRLAGHLERKGFSSGVIGSILRKMPSIEEE
jgi:regulatory protein